MTTRTTAKPWFLPRDYDNIRRAAVDNFNLPQTYDEWFDIATREVANLQARGAVVDRVIVDSKEFARYCVAIGQEQNVATLGAFVIAKKTGRYY